MAQVPVRTITISFNSNGQFSDHSMQIVSLADRRYSPETPPSEWMLQAELEKLLYGSAVETGATGAFYRLLGRSAAGNGAALTLRRNSVVANLVAHDEFDSLKLLLHRGVRVLTLVPLPAVASALATYGPTAASEALIRALGLPRPSEWPALAAAANEGPGASLSLLCFH